MPVEFVVNKPPIPIVDRDATSIRPSSGSGLVSAYQTTGHPTVPVAGDHAFVLTPSEVTAPGGEVGTSADAIRGSIFTSNASRRYCVDREVEEHGAYEGDRVELACTEPSGCACSDNAPLLTVATMAASGTFATNDCFPKEAGSHAQTFKMTRMGLTDFVPDAQPELR